MKVLIVEDSRSIRELICAFVEDVGYLAVPVDSGEAALKTCEVSDIDLVLMDVQLPGIDGYETTRRLRARLGEHWIPIIFLSADYTSSSFVEGINAGGDAYLGKPVNGPVLQAMIKAMGRISEMRNELQRLNHELEALSVLDGLTGLINRRGLDMHLNREWGRANREGAPLSLLLMDVDYFKPFNDTYGHIAGDECLKRVGRAMKQAAMRPADLVCRYGGEEFVMLLPNTTLEGAAVVAEKVRSAVEALREPHAASQVSPHVTVSVGVAEKGTKTYSGDLIAAADRALYKAKENGRNRVEIAS